MSQFFSIHPDNPQHRLIRQAVEIVRKGGLIAYPTDSCYALGCRIGEKSALDRLKRLRQVDDHHAFTLVCADLSSISTYAQVDNRSYRLLKRYTPGPYTFIVPATRAVPRNAWNRRRSIGIRVPENPICQALISELGEPIVSSTLILPNDELPLTDPWDMRERLEHSVDLIIDGGNCGFDMTTVLDMSDGDFSLVREGKGDVSGLLDA